MSHVTNVNLGRFQKATRSNAPPTTIKRYTDASTQIDPAISVATDAQHTAMVMESSISRRVDKPVVVVRRVGIVAPISSRVVVSETQHDA